MSLPSESVQPSSLVFLAIVALWVAYLLPQWIRRRDTLTHSHDDDRHSGGLRVLDPRRRPDRGRSTAPLLGPSYGVSTAVRDGDPGVVEGGDGNPVSDAGVGRTRAVTGPGAPVGSGGGGGRSAAGSSGDGSSGAPGSPGAGAVRPDASRDGVPRDARGHKTSAGGSVPGSGAGPAAGPAPRPGRRPSPARATGAAAARAAAVPRAAARRRAQVLLVLVAVTATGWLAVPATGLPVAVAVASTALLVADLIALRVLALRGAVRRAAASRAAEPRRTAPAADAPAHRPARRGTVQAARAAAATAARRRAAAAAALAADTDSAGEKLSADSTWNPVPVPPPTYTLKPVVPRPEPAALDLSTGGHDGAAPAIPASADDPADEPTGTAHAVAAPPAVVEVGTGTEDRVATSDPAPPRPWEDGRRWADDLDLDAVLARRRAVNG